MKVFLKKDVEKVGMAGEILKVSDGFARNFLLPHDIAVEITALNESQYKNKIKEIAHRKEVIETKTSMLAERISSITLTLKKKMHDDGKLYGAINAHDVVEALAQQGITVAKSQIIFDKSIKNKGVHEAIVKLTSRLQPTIKIAVVAA